MNSARHASGWLDFGVPNSGNAQAWVFAALGIAMALVLFIVWFRLQLTSNLRLLRSPGESRIQAASIALLFAGMSVFVVHAVNFGYVIVFALVGCILLFWARASMIPWIAALVLVACACLAKQTGISLAA